jgi:predicted phosphodiesterase
MRYAIISDIHANLAAWRAVHRDCREVGADVILCLGDVVGYGPQPQAVLDDVRASCQGFVLGDHDALAAGLLEANVLEEQSRALNEWTQNQIDDEAREFLASLPYKMGDDRMLCVHAESEHPDRFGFILDEADARTDLEFSQEQLIFIGHNHVAGLFTRSPDGNVSFGSTAGVRLKDDHRYVVSVGSVGDPLDDDPRASYCMFDSVSNILTFRRVHFDRKAYEEAITQTGIGISPVCLSIPSFNEQPPLQNNQQAAKESGSDEELALLDTVELKPLPSEFLTEHKREFRSKRKGAPLPSKKGCREPTYSPQKIVGLPPLPKQNPIAMIIIWGLVGLAAILLLSLIRMMIVTQ